MFNFTSLKVDQLFKILTSNNYYNEYRENRIYSMDGTDHGTIRPSQGTYHIKTIQVHRDRRGTAARQPGCIATAEDQFEVLAALPH